MTTIETCGHRLLVVPVPGDSYIFEIGSSLGAKQPYLKYCDTRHPDNKRITLPGNAAVEYKIIGLCTAQGPDFDAGPYLPAEESTVMWKGRSAKVELVKPDFIVLDYSFGGSTDLKYGKRYIEEFGTDHRFSVSAKDWLLSLLAANGVHFQNPLGDEMPFTHKPNWDERVANNEWQESQAKVVEKAAIILIK